MIKKKCKECGTLIDPHSQEYCEICHGNHGWWYTCDKHQDLIFREEKKECPVCKLLARVAEASQPEPSRRLISKPKEGASIHKAAGIRQDIAFVIQHLAAGADVNENTTFGTPLHEAAYWGSNKKISTEIIEVLIANGADVNAKNDHGETPLDTAIRRKHPEVADLLRKHGGKAKTPAISIHEAAKKGNIEAVKQHLAEGADVNVKHPRGMTPLHFATGWDHKESVELLIDAGADVNTKDDEGRTPLDLATRLTSWPHVRRKRTEIAALLRKHGGKTGEELKAEGK